MIAMQSFEVLKILNFFEIKSDRISAECGLKVHDNCEYRIKNEQVNDKQVFSICPVS